MTPQQALENYHRAGMRLASLTDLHWDALVGLRTKADETFALQTLGRYIDDFRDACSDLARETQRADQPDGWTHDNPAIGDGW